MNLYSLPKHNTQSPARSEHYRPLFLCILCVSESYVLYRWYWWYQYTTYISSQLRRMFHRLSNQALVELVLLDRRLEEKYFRRTFLRNKGGLGWRQCRVSLYIHVSLCTEYVMCWCNCSTRRRGVWGYTIWITWAELYNISQRNVRLVFIAYY